MTKEYTITVFCFWYFFNCVQQNYSSSSVRRRAWAFSILMFNCLPRSTISLRLLAHTAWWMVADSLRFCIIKTSNSYKIQQSDKTDSRQLQRPHRGCGGGCGGVGYCAFRYPPQLAKVIIQSEAAFCTNCFTS